jgi:hypothetical protein
MPPTPIYDAIYILRKAIYEALDPLTASGIFWFQAAQGAALPFAIYQSQDLGGSAEKAVGKVWWRGLVTLRALATSQSAAETLMTAIRPGMASLAFTGYSIQATYDRPIVIPPDDGVWQTAHSFLVEIDT